MVTHDREMVDKMRKRVIALDGGRLARDERRGGYTTDDALRMILAEAVRSITASMSTTVAATMTVLIGMFVLGLTIGLGYVGALVERPREEAAPRQGLLQGRPSRRQQSEPGRSELDPHVEPAGQEDQVRLPSAEALAIMKKRFPDLTENLTSTRCRTPTR